MTGPALTDSVFLGSTCLQSDTVYGSWLVTEVVGRTHFAEDAETQGNENNYLGRMWQN